MVEPDFLPLATWPPLFHRGSATDAVAAGRRGAAGFGGRRPAAAGRTRARSRGQWRGGRGWGSFLRGAHGPDRSLAGPRLRPRAHVPAASLGTAAIANSARAVSGGGEEATPG